MAGGSCDADSGSTRVGPEGGQELVEESLKAIAQLWQ
jgi:hypothetical protein